MIRISDKITLKDVKTWDKQIITISAGTGAGKSFFIKNILYDFAKSNNKKILMLIHRSNCVDQFREEVIRDKKDDVIHIKTYQSLESLKNKYKKEFNFKNYQYIVADEFHYFTGDAAFNKNTDISLNMILKQTDITRIFMSATGSSVKKYINGVKGIQTIDYELPANYNFIESLSFFVKDDILYSLAKNLIKQDTKAIFFIQSAEKAYNLYKKYKKNCLFNCGKHNTEYYKYVDKQKINKMLTDSKFEELILITTSCLDAGVNIIDTDVKNIIVDIEDIGSLIQCIGRKRIQNNNDKIKLYIKSINNCQLGGKETQLQNKLKMAEFFKTHTVKEYIEKFYKEYDKTNMVYDDIVDEDDKGTKKLNELMYFKCKNDIKDIQRIIKYGSYGYCKYLAKLFGFYNSDINYYLYSIIEDETNKYNLEEYLEKIMDKKLFKKEQNELIEKIGLKDARGRIQKSIRQFNIYFEENKINFLLINARSSQRENGKVKYIRYWKVIKTI